MPRAVVILNPIATNFAREDQLDRALGPWRDLGWSLAVERTCGPGAATALARHAVAANYDVVIAGGGDGTVNEVVQGLAHSQAILGVLPLGMENLWAREIGLPLTASAAVRAQANGQVRRVDLGQASWIGGQRRYFLLMAGVGLDAEVVRQLHPRLKRSFRRLAYFSIGVYTALRLRPSNVEVTGRDEVIRCPATFVLAGNTRLYASGLRVTPDARLDDGLLDLCVFRGGGVWRAVAWAGELLLRRHSRDRDVLYRRAAGFRVRATPPLWVQLDGELAGRTPVALSSERRALRVIVPQEGARLFGADSRPEGFP